MTTSAPSRLPAGASGVATWWRRDARLDLPASLVVFLVALPLSIGIAVASDAPVTAGLIAAAVGGIVAGALGGSVLGVSGPAAGLTVVVAGLVQQFGFAATCAITVAAGLLQMLLGASRVARAALAISPAVLHAMLAGIGVTIVLGQVHVLLGGTSQSDAVENVTALPGQLADLHGPALLVGGAVIAVLVAWKRVPAKFRVVPGQLVAIVAVTALTLGLDVTRVELPGSLLSSLSLPEVPSGGLGAIVLGVLTLTIIASVESLLSALATDRLAGERPDPAARPRRTNLDRELVGQGVANTASGLLGGLPITNVIVRSSTNVAMGARTRASAILHGVWVLLFSLALVSLIELIPMAALAGLLVMMGIGLVKWNDISTARAHGELAVYVVTLLGVVVLNLLEGVAIGLLLAGLLVMRRAVWARIRVVEGPRNGRRHFTVDVDGTLTFPSVPRLAHHLARIPAGADVTVNLDVDYLDHTAHDHLAEWRRTAEASGSIVRIDEIGTAGVREHDGRRRPRSGTPRHLAPWSVWQSDDNAGRPLAAAIGDAHADLAPLSGLLTGVHDFHLRSAPRLGGVFADLAAGQHPQTLFLTCADSRVVPNVITSSGPGDLFTVRNVGNLVPDDADDSVAAGIEYAVGVLGVRNVVVCGHSGCGAMNALRSGGADDSALGRWLRAGRRSVEAFEAGHPVRTTAEDDGCDAVDALAKVNVAVQVERIRAIPVVAAALAAGEVQVGGLFFDIATARVEVLEGSADRFVTPAAAVEGLGSAPV